MPLKFIRLNRLGTINNLTFFLFLIRKYQSSEVIFSFIETHLIFSDDDPLRSIFKNKNVNYTSQVQISGSSINGSTIVYAAPLNIQPGFQQSR